MKRKELDCVQLRHRGAEAIRKKLAGKTREQQLEYWRKRTEELGERQETLRQGHGALRRGS